MEDKTFKRMEKKKDTKNMWMKNEELIRKRRREEREINEEM